MLFWIFLPNGKLRVKNVGIEAMVDFLVSRFFWSVGLLIRRFNPPKDVEFFCASRSEVCPRMPTYSNAHAKVKKWIFEVQFVGN